MKSYVRHIGILDTHGSVHAVSFEPGVNVVTGRSSTGKSALIEIFDYCFGSSDFTVPDGVITDNAAIYFITLQIEQSHLVIGRRANSGHVFLREDNSEELVANPNFITLSYFIQSDFWPLSDFKKELGRFLGLTITDTDESSEVRGFRGQKSPAPSIRSMVSFMLQHQNLVANKHAVFYRFDEQAKRDQAIDHFRIFVGFVDQIFFTKSQQLNELKIEARKLEAQIPKLEDLRGRAEQSLTQALNAFAAISGQRLTGDTPAELLSRPRKSLEAIGQQPLLVVPTSNEHSQMRSELEKDNSTKISELRQLQRKIRGIEASIESAKAYSKDAESVAVPVNAQIKVSECPFCHSTNDNLEHEANLLSDAINWLNDELERSPYLLESFETDRRLVEKEIESKRIEIAEIGERLNSLDKQIKELAGFRSQYELALKEKLRVEGILESFLDKRDDKLKERLKEIKKQVDELQAFLKKHYELQKKLDDAEKEIAKAMNAIGSTFEFEDSYRPINLHLSLSTFDLWHQKDERKIFLRSMGSGANWLYCHVSLFLGLQRFFCDLGKQCLIPSIVFFDQPSQVYFPSQLDNGPAFDADELAEKEGAARTRPVDDDIKAVTNLYSQMVAFCAQTEAETGIKPQIIVTDHADHLTLDGEVAFETLVRARWRDREDGFVKLQKNEV